MDLMNKCFFCGADAPRPRKIKGAYVMECSCGMKLYHPDYEMVYEMWNYTVK